MPSSRSRLRLESSFFTLSFTRRAERSTLFVRNHDVIDSLEIVPVVVDAANKALSETRTCHIETHLTGFRAVLFFFFFTTHRDYRGSNRRYERFEKHRVVALSE